MLWSHSVEASSPLPIALFAGEAGKDAPLGFREGGEDRGEMVLRSGHGFESFQPLTECRLQGETSEERGSLRARGRESPLGPTARRPIFGAQGGAQTRL
jgi:hypothetical protein